MDGRLELIDWVARNKLSMLAKPAAKIKAEKSPALQAVAAEFAASGQSRALSTGA